MRLAELLRTTAIAALPALVLSAGVWALAFAQSEAPIRLAEKKKAAPKAKEKSKAKEKKDAGKKGGPTPATYATMPIAERAAIQFDLNWTNHYTGIANGNFGDNSVAAVKAFQKDRGYRETGVLASSEREALATSAKNRRERAGWRMVEDRVTGAQVGLPSKLATHESKSGSGTRWQSAQGQLQIETFRIREPGATLASVFEDQKRVLPSRRVESSALRENSFTLAGMQGLKRFLVHAEIRDLEIRGITILYDQAIESTTNYVSYGVASAFAPFPGTGVMALIGPPSRSRVEYGTGIVVTANGHVLTDRQLTEGCSVLEIAGFGDASRLAEHDRVTLLQVFGASSLTPAALVHPGVSAGNLTLVGIADPQAQGGERATSAVPARLDGDALEPAPRLGFSGAAALDAQGRMFGMVTLKAPVLASAGTLTVPPATIVPTRELRNFLDTQYVTPATGAAGVDAAKASVVRVICVRR